MFRCTRHLVGITLFVMGASLSGCSPTPATPNAAGEVAVPGSGGQKVLKDAPLDMGAVQAGGSGMPVAGTAAGGGSRAGEKVVGDAAPDTTGSSQGGSGMPIGK